MKQFFRFGLVGTLGFLTDATILVVLVHLCHIHPLAARPFSFLTANFATWWCNRHFTFSPNPKRKIHHEWMRYFSVNGIGAVINLGIYSLLIIYDHRWLSLPIIALAIASIVAMVFNYFSSKYFAFS
jgi:putative flippase GtrA